MKYKFIHYWDVWGNPDDGFEVNDVARLGDVELDIQDSDTDEAVAKKIAKALAEWFDPERLMKAGFHLDSTVCGDGVFELNLWDSGPDGERDTPVAKPFGRLEKIDVDCPGG